MYLGRKPATENLHIVFLVGRARPRSPKNDKDLMFNAMVDEGNVRGVGQRLAVQFSSGNTAGNASGIFHLNSVARRVIAEKDRIVGPSSRDARVDAKCCSAHAESENPLHPCAIEPPR